MTYDNQHAWTSYRIGYSFAQNRQNILAIEYYDKAVALAPYILEFKIKLADLLLNQGDYEKSIIHYKNILNFDVVSDNNGKLLKSKTPPFPAPYKLPDGPFNTSASRN